MKRLNEYTIDELRNLELLLSIAGNHDCVIQPENGLKKKLRDLDVVKFWAEQVNEAMRDVELENEQLPFDYKPVN